MTRIAPLGAGGKKGVRPAENMRQADHVEISMEVRLRLKEEAGVDCLEPDSAVGSTDGVIAAVSDRLIGSVWSRIIGPVSPGTGS